MRFTVLLFYDAESASYDAVVPALPNRVTCGATIEEALATARDAAAIRLEQMADDGEEIAGGTEATVVAAIDVDIPVPALALAD